MTASIGRRAYERQLPETAAVLVVVCYAEVDTRIVPMQMVRFLLYSSQPLLRLLCATEKYSVHAFEFMWFIAMNERTSLCAAQKCQTFMNETHTHAEMQT